MLPTSQNQDKFNEWNWWLCLVLKAKQFQHVAVVVCFGVASSETPNHDTALHQLCSGHGQIETPHPVPILPENGFARTILV